MTGKQHGYDGACAPMPNQIYSAFETFSLGVFEWVPTANGLGTKRGKVKVRVSGPREESIAIYDKAKEIVAELDRDEYYGPKHVRISHAKRQQEETTL